MWARLKIFFDLVKFEHTVFALPFAYLGMLLARGGWPSFGVFFWITAAMVSARTAGMTLNRLIDLRIDEKNPRTQNRPSVTGAVSPAAAGLLAGGSLAVFFVSAWMLNPLCFRLSWIAVLLLSGYHYVKRFSFLCHFSLGLVLAIAPAGGWLAVTGAFSWIPVPLSLAVLFWVAGFDIIYSLQDMEFDRTHGLHSVPARFGQSAALRVSFICHAAAVALLAVFGAAARLGPIYWTGAAVTAALLYTEHVIVREGDSNRIQTAFFTINGWVGIILFIFTFLETFR